jgi:hypothetical protein
MATEIDERGPCAGWPAGTCTADGVYPLDCWDAAGAFQVALCPTCANRLCTDCEVPA